ncbi:uncharacterized protein ColSpa_01349 [Colletotrichum spaethianum]|uniref:Hypervirulence associated protein TUDOR domain-containing protein n=1 Tax=Colletotrichum spaethianum TaxID=700344 RepID=A0AA37NYH4_9PEZI|nr:uncharacterized protein ColSpa_01349 [Colletotrichum spaethianum]GKT41168.1 hypothetical protein ColSpa_01349 [Colletotrichum spaethianum]
MSRTNVVDSKRHLAQESESNSDKSPEELKKTKSYASLKNWGHDFLKAQGKESGAAKSNGKSSKKEGEDEEDEVEQVDNGETEEADEEVEEKSGDKRKNNSDENGTSKKRQTRQGEGQATKESGKNGNKKEEADEEDGDEELEDDDEDGGDGKETTKGPKKGDTVSWNWGNGQPEGKVLDVKGEKTTIETKRGNEVTRDGKPEDPAVVLDTGKSKAIKSAHELNES